ncbi:MAG: hypothetical protein AAGE52_37780 [Myxococcota bacterium]
MRASLCLTLILVAIACANEPTNFERAETVTVMDAVPTRLTADDLRGTSPLATSESVLVGVTVDPETNQRFVLSAAGELFREQDGEWSLFQTLPPVGSGLTDIAALGNDRFAVTAMSNGYLFDAQTGELALHFCYEPGGWEDEPQLAQLSDSLAYDAERERIYAQPRTLDLFSGTASESFFSAYDRAGGEDLEWWIHPDVTFHPTGIAVDPQGNGVTATLFVTSGDTLLSFDGDTAELIATADLSDLGLDTAQIRGLAVDAEALLVLEAPVGGEARLVEIALDAL